MIGMVLNMPPFCTRLAIPVNVGGQFGAENVKVEIDISEGSPLTWPGLVFCPARRVLLNL
jgi:hypothetical protein